MKKGPAILLSVVAAVLALWSVVETAPADQVRPVPGKQSYSESIEDAIRRGGTVVIEARDEPYVIDNLVIDRPVRIVGYGAALRIRDDWTDRKEMALTLRASVSIEGLTIIAGGSYAAISVESSGCILSDVQVYDYSYKGVRVLVDDPDGWFAAWRCYAESDRGNGSHDFAAGGVYPIAYQVDSGPGRSIGRVLFAGCVAGPHPNTTSGGQSIKIATTGLAVIERFSTAGPTDPKNANTLIVGEDVGRLVVRDSDLPRGIIHYPDPKHGNPDVGYLIVENTTLGGDAAPTNLHDHLRARRLVYRGVDVVGIDNTALIDETPVRASRRFEDTSFTTRRAVASHGRWEPQVYFDRSGADHDLDWAGVELEGPAELPLRWSAQADQQKQWEAR